MSGQFDADGSREISYNPERDSYSVEFDQTRDAPSVKLIIAMAEIEGGGTDDVEPLYERIDPDALDAIFRRDSVTTVERNGRLSFTFNGRDVTVWAEGRIDISLTDAELEREREAFKRESEATTAERDDETGRE